MICKTKTDGTFNLIMEKILFIVILALTKPAIGQRHLVGIQGGVNFASVDQTSFSHGRTAFSGGLRYDYKLTPNLALSSGLLLNPRGFNVEETLVNFVTGESYQQKSSNEYGYVSIPLMVTYAGATRIYPFISLGLLPSILTKAKVVVERSEFQKVYFSFEKTDIVSKVDLAGVADVGGGLRISQPLTVFVTASYQKSLVPATETYTIEPDVVEKFDMKHEAISFSVGLQYAILKRSRETAAD